MGLDNAWTAEEDAALREMFAQGKRDGEIAQALGRPRMGVKGRRHFLRLLKFENCQRRAVPEDFLEHARLSGTVLCERYGVGQKTIIRWRRECGVVVKHNGWSAGTLDHKRVAKAIRLPKEPKPVAPKRDKVWKHWGRRPERVIDGSLTYQAARYLQRYFVPVFRLNIQQPKADPNLYRVGTKTMTTGDMIDLAEQHGFKSSDVISDLSTPALACKPRRAESVVMAATLFSPTDDYWNAA